ncbi:MAG: hypothetical protein ACREFD_00220 [Stellaceae bacterium]
MNGSSPIRQIRLGPRNVAASHRPDGSITLRSPHELGRYPVNLTDRLVAAATAHLDRTLFAARDTNGARRELSYDAALRTARAIGAAFLARDLSAKRPVVILSGAGIEHLHGRVP